jgi:twitching motility protein PilJ
MFDRLKKALRIPLKLGLIVALLLVPLGLLIYDFSVASSTDIRFAEKEILGVQYLAPVRRLLQHAAQHRDLAVLVLAGDASQEAARKAREAEVEADLKALAAVDERLGTALGTAGLVRSLTADWQGTRDHVTLRGLDAPGSFAEHTALLAEAYDLIRRVGDSSNLILDPDLDSYYLMEAVVVSLPQAAEALGQLRGFGAGVARRGAATIQERAQLGQLAEGGRQQVQSMQRGFGVAVATNPALATSIGAPVKEMMSGVDAFLNLTDRQLVNAQETVRIAPAGYLTAGTLAVDRLFGLYDRSLDRLHALLEARIDRLAGQRNRRLLLSGLLTLAALIGTFLIIRGINRQVRTIDTTLHEIGTGNLGARARVVTADELGATAQVLNSMLDNIRGLMQSQEERDQIQAAIMKLLTEVSTVAEGDLRAEAEVGADITGAIADSFNYMIVELRRIIDRVKATSTEVSAAAGGVRTTAESLAAGSSAQAAEIDQTAAVMEQMAAAIQQASEQALAAARVAEQALARARQGTESVTRTIEGMTAIRGQVQETSRRIKRLGESSQEIGEIVQVIGDIADRTSILALNATIQAASAGEAGRGFMVVAEEVERLAQRAAASSKSIGSLVKAIQSETHEAVAAMEGTTREVVGGSGLALAAGRSLQEIEDVSVQLAELIRAISEVTSRQARGSQDVAQTMGRLSGLTTRTAAATREAARSIQSLALLADELRESTERFKLPEKAA